MILIKLYEVKAVSFIVILESFSLSSSSVSSSTKLVLLLHRLIYDQFYIEGK